MTIALSDRVQAIKPSPTLAVSARANELRAEGKHIINLGVGEPDFDTPEHIKEAAIKALHDGFTKYTPVDGIPSLKEAIIHKFASMNQLQYAADQILVSVGGKQSFFNLAQALINPGDEVIIPAPYWVSYPDMVLLAGGKPVIVEAGFDQDYKMTAEQLDAAITDKTKLFVINSPSNPTGIMYSPTELAAIAEVLMDHPQIIIATDDMYEYISWADFPFSNILNVKPELYDRTMVLNSVSKAYAMTGWRIGYTGGPKHIIQSMKKIQSQSTSNPCSIAQVAAEEALKSDQGCVKMMLEAFKARHELVYERLSAIDGVKVHRSHGTFYTFPNVQAIIDHLDGINTDIDFAEYLLQEAGVAIVPGTAFGSPGSIRLSFAASTETLGDALQRIAKTVS